MAVENDSESYDAVWVRDRQEAELEAAEIRGQDARDRE